MNDLISRQAAIDAMNEVYCHIEMIKNRPVNKTEQAMYLDMIGAVKSVPSAEPLTDKEQRIFLAAMGREEKVCEEVDRNHVREPYEDSLVRTCHEITRKVKGALWT